MHLYSELGSVRTANSCDDCSALSSWEFVVDVRLVDPKSMLLCLTSRPVQDRTTADNECELACDLECNVAL